MNNDIHVLAQIETTVLRSETILGGDAEQMGGYSDRDALQRILGIARRAIQQQATGAAVVATSAASQSSVQIEQAAKGAPRVTVKVYSEDAAEALVEATTLYDQAVGKYAEAAKVTSAEVQS